MSKSPKKPELSGSEVGGFPLWGSQRVSHRNRLLEFRAGKMYVKENMVYPDKRKGLVYIYHDDDGKIHFCWMDRCRGVVEDDFIITPRDCVFKKVDRCTTGRVYMLKLHSSNRIMFFWMQEPSDENDFEICTEVNTLLNTPPTTLIQELMKVSELNFLMSQINAEQILVPFNVRDIAWVDARNQQSESSYLESTINTNPGEINDTVDTTDSQVPDGEPFVNFTDVIGESSIKVLRNSNSMDTIINKLPVVNCNEENQLENTIKSVHFKRSVTEFSEGLKLGTMGHALKDLGLNDAAVAAADEGDVDSFIKALNQGSPGTTSRQQDKHHEPGNSGSYQSRQNKDETPNNNTKEPGRSGKNDKNSESQKTSRKRKHETTEYETVSTEEVEIEQQTDPVLIKSAPRKGGRKTKVSKKQQTFAERSVHIDRSQNTDPVEVEEIPRKRQKLKDPPNRDNPNDETK